MRSFNKVDTESTGEENRCGKNRKAEELTGPVLLWCDGATCNLTATELQSQKEDHSGG